MSDAIPRRKPMFTTYDAIQFRDNVLNKWHPWTDVWAFKFGDDILSFLTICGNILITHKFRRELKLLPYARVTCYIPVVGIGSLFGFAANHFFISAEIVKSNRCPLCITTKAALIQVAIGVAYPLVTAGLTCIYMADKLLTYPVPPLITAPKEVFNLAKRIVMKNPRPYLILGAIHMIASSFINFHKQETLVRLDPQLNRR